ncbi:MAG: helix-turn-helix transcriptional regulator, partial [Clostridia bacterium]|nr:helix-turn-helix transcriptional regulator [Clostridia bacterium]
MGKGQIRYMEKPFVGGELFTIRAAGRTQTASMQRVRHGEPDGFRLEYMLEGTGYVRREEDGQILQVTAGQMLFVRQGCEATIWADREKPVDRVWFLAEGELLSTLFALYRIPDVYAAASPALPECMALLDLLEAGETGGAVSAQAAALLSSILVRTMAPVLFPEDRSGESTARQMQVYIDGHLYEDLRLDGLAVRFGYAKMHLIRLFRAEIGIT